MLQAIQYADQFVMEALKRVGLRGQLPLHILAVEEHSSEGTPQVLNCLNFENGAFNASEGGSVFAQHG